MSVAERPAGSTAERRPEWPNVFAVRVWLLPEDDNWVAVAPDFDVVSQGRDEALALRSLEGMIVEYLETCCDEGLSFVEARRPIPLAERLRFYLSWIASRPSKWLKRRGPAREGLFLPAVHGNARC
jgi:predicted RNase H-like HicB family nuclease